MKVFDLAKDVPQADKNCVVAVGNFDAVHLGHQALLAEAKSLAATRGVPFAVLTFEPHPRRVFRADDPPFRVTPLAVKLDRLAASGVDCVYVCPFNWDLAGLSPEQFIQTILKDKIAPALIVTGQDFHFGHNRSGNAALLKQSGFEVVSISLKADGQHAVISATRVRGALQAGHLDEANALLGWNWELRGVVQHGDKRGREIGYPTANIPLGETIHPAYGVYATYVQIEGEDVWRKAATNIGIRPMFELPTGLVEAHILDYEGDIYGKTVRVRPVRKIRDEMKFSSLDLLVAQIDSDCEEARKILA